MSTVITRRVVLLEINAEPVALHLSQAGWEQVLAIAAAESGGSLSVAPVPNQAIFEQLVEGAGKDKKTS